MSITYHIMKLSYGKEIRLLSSPRKTAVAETPAFPYTHHIQKTQNMQYLKKNHYSNTQNSNTPRIHNSKDLITNKN